MLIPLAHAQAQAQPEPSGMYQLALIGAMFVLFYFILIRPQRKRQKEHQAMVASLNVGDEVVTVSGILGSIKSIDGDYLHLQAANNIVLTLQRVAIHAVLPKGTLKTIQTDDS